MEAKEIEVPIENEVFHVQNGEFPLIIQLKDKVTEEEAKDLKNVLFVNFKTKTYKKVVITKEENGSLYTTKLV